AVSRQEDDRALEGVVAQRLLHVEAGCLWHRKVVHQAARLEGAYFGEERVRRGEGPDLEAAPRQQPFQAAEDRRVVIDEGDRGEGRGGRLAAAFVSPALTEPGRPASTAGSTSRKATLPGE